MREFFGHGAGGVERDYVAGAWPAMIGNIAHALTLRLPASQLAQLVRYPVPECGTNPGNTTRCLAPDGRAVGFALIAEYPALGGQADGRRPPSADAIKSSLKVACAYPGACITAASSAVANE